MDVGKLTGGVQKSEDPKSLMELIVSRGESDNLIGQIQEAIGKGNGQTEKIPWTACFQLVKFRSQTS